MIFLIVVGGIEKAGLSQFKDVKFKKFVSQFKPEDHVGVTH